MSYHAAPPDDTTKNKRAFLPILKPSGPDDGIKFPPKFCKTLTGRLPPEDGSVRPQTLGKRVSDDSRHFIFGRPKMFFGDFCFQKFWRRFFLPKTFLGRRKMKCWESSVFPKFEAERSHIRGVNGHSKFGIFFGFRRRKIKCRESSETRFGQASGQSEPSSERERPFKV